MGGVLVPSGVHRVTHDVSGLREDLLDQDFLPTQSDPLAQIRCDSDHQTLAGRHTLSLPLRLPALQLSNHWSQLVVPSLLIQLGEVLSGGTGRDTVGDGTNVKRLIKQLMRQIKGWVKSNWADELTNDWVNELRDKTNLKTGHGTTLRTTDRTSYKVVSTHFEGEDVSH